MAIERNGSTTEEEEVVDETRTNDPEANGVLDFEPYHDQPQDEVHPFERVQPEATQDVLTGDVPTEDASIESPSSRSLLRKSSLIRATITFGIYFLIIGTSLFMIDILPRFRKPPRPLPTQPPPPYSNFHLNFPEVYPILDLERSNASCRAAWATLTDIQCHEGIWSRGWDYGIPHPTTGDSETAALEIEKVVPLICGGVSPQRTMCHVHLELAKGLVYKACVG